MKGRRDTALSLLSVRIPFLVAALLVTAWLGEPAKAAGDVPCAGLPSGLTETEKTDLLKENDPKDHVEKCMKIAGLRLVHARAALNGENYAEVDQSLTIYNRLVCYAHSYTRGAVQNPKKRDKIYRIMETTMRRQLPVFELITRDCPERSEHALMLVGLQGIRKQLLNSVFGGDFLRVENVSHKTTDDDK